jgi:cytochrome b561
VPAILSSKKTLMQPVTPAATRYDRTTIWIHWLTVALVAFQWLSANLIDEFAKGAPRMMAKSVHIASRAILLTLMLYRVFWRSTGGRRLPPADRPALHVVAKATHWGLYALLFTTVGLGILTAWARGDSVFGLLSLPPLAPGDPGLGDRMREIHGTFVNIVLILAAVHASAAILHHLVWRDGVLARMLPLGPGRVTAQPGHTNKGRVT